MPPSFFLPAENASEIVGDGPLASGKSALSLPSAVASAPATRVKGFAPALSAASADPGEGEPLLEQYDVLVVGGGPAGSTAAWAAARKGARVALLEACSVPRGKLCGGLLSRKTIGMLHRLHGMDERALRDCGIIGFSSSRYDVFFGDRLLCSDRYEYPFHFTERAVFDAWLLEQARQAGVAIFSKASVVWADTREGSVHLADGRRTRGRFLIGADGVNSAVRRAFPIDRRRWARSLAATVEVRLPRADLPHAPDKPQIFLGWLAEGYGWVFPQRDFVVVGLGGKLDRARERSFAKLFRRFLEQVGVRDSPLQPLHGHPLPYGGYLPPLVCGRGLLAGDAGGLVESVFGEGIFFAMRSGELAGEIAARSCTEGKAGTGIAQYPALLREDVLAEIAASRRVQRCIALCGRYELLHPVLRWGVLRGRRALLDVIHGRRSYRHFRRLPDTDSRVAERQTFPS